MAPERRIDPDDGHGYTWEELSSYYAGTYRKKEIAQYWELCAPTKTTSKAKAKAKVKAKAKAKTAKPEPEPALKAVPFDESKNRQIVVKSLLKSNSQAVVSSRNVELVVVDKPTPGEGQALVHVVYVSIDPTHRIWLTDKTQYFAPANLDAPMRAITLGKVEASTDPALPVGSWCAGLGNVQDYYVASPQTGTFKVEEVPGRPITAHLAVLGKVIGLTAWAGVHEIIKPKKEEVFVVSAAAGAVGSLAGQLAKFEGAKVIGFAGSDSKCKWLTEECGFDHAVNYKTDNLVDRLKELAPDGIDCYFENVGGPCTEAVFQNFRNNARVALCGLISSYNSGKTAGLRNYENILHRRVMVKGFISSDYSDKFPEMFPKMSEYVAQGKVKWSEDIQEGIENYASILNRLYNGMNTGKLIMKV